MSKIFLFEKLSKEKQSAILVAGLTEFSTKTYSEASTDRITSACNISKGLLFHYFGSKKDFYLYCLSKSLDQLVSPIHKANGNDFYEILFNSMDQKIRLCIEYPLQYKLVNMASRDASSEIAAEKNTLLKKYIAKVHIRSIETLESGISTLKLKEPDNSRIKEGLSLYVSAIINKYLLAFHEKPEDFFKQSEYLKKEFRSYIELMLKGIEKE